MFASVTPSTSRLLAATADFPTDPHAFAHNHSAPRRPAKGALAHQILKRPVHVTPVSRGRGPRASGPVVLPGALDPRKAAKNVGAIVVSFMARHPSTPAPSPTPVTLGQRRLVTGNARHPATVDISSENVTGINPWWSYEEGAIAGVGRWMVNAHSGNLLLQSDDMAVSHRGIDLAFRRTYNSFSRHDYWGTDGATEIGQYGGGWTNTFDAHISTNGCPNTGYAWAGFYGFSVHDVDGARYDYCFNAAGQLIAPTGMQGTSLVANPDGGSFYWTKKNGTQYAFYAPYYGGTSAAYSGRIYRISGRNQNNYLQFSYAWNPDASSSANLTNIYVATDNGGLQATLTFAGFNGQVLLSQLTRPDLATVSYSYDADGELISVSKPPPNDSGVPVLETYNGYQSFLMVAGPRWNSGGDNDGGYVAFQMDETKTAQVNGIEWVGVMNFTPSDGTNALLQPSVETGPILYRWEGVSAQPTYTSFTDTDGHGTVQYVDGAGRPTTRQEYTGSLWLQTSEAWDTSNDLTATVDARGNETDYVYDVDGNTVAAAAPPPTPGASRPTRLFSYDAHDNVTAYCDPNSTPSISAAAAFPPAAPAPGPGGLCPQSGVATQYHWNPTTDEPFGELDVMTSPATTTVPTGYQRTISYDLGPQGGVDYGLPTRVLGAPITQSGDPATPTRQPQQTFWYDGNGNLACYGTGSGQWILTYDNLNRLKTASDPDDSATPSGTCLKSGAQSGWNTTSHTDYFPDGSVKSKQSASQYAAGVATTFTYDLDGNAQTETHHYGCTSTASCTAGLTTKWYDGADRLVEVQQPFDISDIQAYAWSTRYIYDLSGGGTTAYHGMGLAGHGNLVSTRELLSGAVWSPAVGQTYSISTGTWMDVRATTFDALDRPVWSYEAALGDQPKTANGYDAPGAAGLLSSVHLATGETKYLTYDGMGRETMVSYLNDNGVTPTIQQTYDRASHVVSRNTSVLGSETLAYDATGAVTSLTEPASLGGGTISYGYYADGMRASAGYSDATINAPTALQYAYRADGTRERLGLPNGTAFGWTYTAAGRLQSQSDPLTGTMVHPDAVYTSGKVEKPYYPSSVTYAARTQAFDTYGRVLSITLPVNLFAYTGSQFDLEDGVAQHTASPYVPAGSTGPYMGSSLMCLQSSIRNEKTTLSISQQAYPQPPYCTMGPGAPFEINGMQLTGGPPTRFTTAQMWTLDARAGMLLHNTQPLGSDTMGASYAYDSSGRLNQDFEGAAEQVTKSTGPTFSNNWCPGVSPPAYAAVTCFSNGSRSKTYDAENRLRTETFTYQPYNTGTGAPTYSTTSYGFAEYGAYWADSSGYGQPPNIQAVDYGASSHPMRFSLYHPDWAAGGNNTTETRAWLWDGNDRFLECPLNSNSCQTPWLSIEGLGDFDLANNTIVRLNDRNRNAQVVMARTATAFSGWTDTPLRSRTTALAPCSTTGPANIRYTTSGVCGKQHDGKLTADGWTLDYEAWQGVRTYDPAVGQWNTPDAYAGEVHDPMSQKPFMWNRNNAYDYSDPSGYDARATEQAIEAEVLFGGEMTALARAELRMTQRAVAASEKLGNIRKSMYRGGQQEVAGGTPGAIRNELKTGQPTKGKFHLTKGNDLINALNKWLRENPTASKEERSEAEQMLKDLKDAFGNVNPAQFKNGNNAPPSVSSQGPPNPQ
jgi:YD repeat-containing protein